MYIVQGTNLQIDYQVVLSLSLSLWPVANLSAAESD